MMEGSVASRLLDKGQRVEDESLYGLTSRFQRDFSSKFNDLIGYADRAEQRELGDRKRASLQNISNTSSVKNVSNTRNVSQQRVVNQYGASPISSAPTSAANDETMTELKDTNKGILSFIKKEKRGGREGGMTSSMIHAQLIQSAIAGAKNYLFGGPTATEQIVSAVKNVEKAIRKEKSVELDMRTRFQKGYEKYQQGGGLGDILKDLTEDISNSVGNTFGGASMGTTARSTVGQLMDDKGMSSFFNKVGEKFRNMDVGSIFDGVGESAGSSKSKGAKKKARKKVKDDSENFFSKIVDTVTGTFNKTAKSKWTKRKSALISGALLFGDFQQSMLTTGLLHPLKSLRMAIAGLGMGLQTVKNVPVLLSLGTAFQQFGLQGGALATIPILLIRAYGAMENFGDGAQDMMKNFFTGGKRWMRRAGLASLSFINEVVDTGSRMKDVIIDWGSRAYEAMRKVKQGLGETMSNMFSALSGVMSGFGKNMKKAGGGILDFLGQFGGWIVAALPAIGTALVAAFGVFMAALPFILIGLAVAAVVGAGYLIYKNWDTVKEKFNEYITTPFMNMMESITSTLSGWGTKLVQMKDDLVAKVLGIKDSIGNAVSNIFSGIMDKVKSSLSWLPDSMNPFSGDEDSGSTDKTQPQKSETSRDVTPSQTEAVKVRSTPMVGLGGVPAAPMSTTMMEKKLDLLIKAVQETGAAPALIYPDSGPNDIRTLMETR